MVRKLENICSIQIHVRINELNKIKELAKFIQSTQIGSKKFYKNNDKGKGKLLQ